MVLEVDPSNVIYDPKYAFKNLIEKQIDYAVALKTALIGDESARRSLCDKVLEASREEFQNQWRSKLDEPTDTWSNEELLDSAEFRNFQSQRINQLKHKVFQLRKTLSDTRVLRQQLEEVYREQFPNVHKTSLCSLLSCLNELKIKTDRVILETTHETASVE